jgi:hypothetical protein
MRAESAAMNAVVVAANLLAVVVAVVHRVVMLGVIPDAADHGERM